MISLLFMELKRLFVDKEGQIETLASFHSKWNSNWLNYSATALFDRCGRLLVWINLVVVLLDSPVFSISNSLGVAH